MTVGQDVIRLILATENEDATTAGEILVRYSGDDLLAGMTGFAHSAAKLLARMKGVSVEQALDEMLILFDRSYGKGGPW